MTERLEDLIKKQRYERMRILFEEVKTMQMMGWTDVSEMSEALEINEDYTHFVNNYLNAHKNEELECIICKAYKLLYDESVPMYQKAESEEESGPEAVIETEKQPNRETMEVICTRRLIETFIRDRVEYTICQLASKTYDPRNFVAAGFDREYVECMVRIIRLFSPTIEVRRSMIQDEKRMLTIVDRIYEELYTLNTKRKKLWSCDKLDFIGLRKYEGGE